MAAGAGLVDRYAEIAVLDRLVAETRAGSSGVLVLSGEAGIGKTALLDYTAEKAAGMRIVRVEGIEAEFELPFAALHQLLKPLLDDVDALPDAQRDALTSAFGRYGGGPGRSFLVALAVLTLFSSVAEQTPLFCVIDDAEFIDDSSAQALAFAARRLDSERIVMLFACGDGAGESRFAGLPTLGVKGLSTAAAGELLDGTAGPGLDGRVRERLISELEGNPLALIELVHELTPEQLEGSMALPEALPLGERLETALLRRVRNLPDESQRLLLLVAAERSGEPAVIWRAADRLGIAGSALVPAEGAIRVGEQLTFRHALVRAAVYAAASEQLRREAHLALAEAMDPLSDWDRAAWHRGAASGGPDEAVATALEAAADTAKERGGYGATGAFLEFAARLTPDAGVRARRSLDAAEAQLAAGELEKAALLLTAATAQPLAEPQRAQARELRANLASARGENGHTSGLLLEVARELEDFDERRARATYLQALTHSLFAGRLGPRDAVLTAARAARSAPRAPEGEADDTDLLLEGLAVRFTDGPAAAAPLLRRAVDGIRDYGGFVSVGPAYIAAFELWDDDAIHAVAARRAALARATGALVQLPNALVQLGAYEVLAGRFDAAEAYFDEAGEIAAATRIPGPMGQSLVPVVKLEAWRGHEDATRALVRSCVNDGTARGLGSFVGVAQQALAVLELGLGNYRAALNAAQDASLDEVLATRMLPEVVEAAVRADEPDIAAAAAQLLEESAVASGTNWGLGVLACCRALIAEDADAEALYREAIDHLKRCRAAPHLARARLVYGEWLRRIRRRRDAREELRSAHELFQAMGAAAFARRAEAELAATGEHRRRRGADTAETAAALTPQEWRIAALVREGATNSEVAAQLYISPRTVEYHLSKVFRKLGVNSRTELGHVLSDLSRNRGR